MPSHLSRLTRKRGFSLYPSILHLVHTTLCSLGPQHFVNPSTRSVAVPSTIISSLLHPSSLYSYVTLLLRLTFVVQLLSRVQLFATPWAAAHQASLSFTISQSLLKLMSIESVMPSNHLILCHPLLLLPSIFPNESPIHIRWPNYWNFSFSIRPSNEYSGLISFRIGWFNLVQETLKSLLWHHSSKASIIWCSAFFMVQLSHPYMTTEKNP